MYTKIYTMVYMLMYLPTMYIIPNAVDSNNMMYMILCICTLLKRVRSNVPFRVDSQNVQNFIQKQ
jgi:hypothetical protein